MDEIEPLATNRRQVSRVSEDKVYNCSTDPNCVRSSYTWQMHVDGMDDDGKRIYALDDSANRGAVFPFSDKVTISPNSAVVCAHVECETMEKVSIGRQVSELYRAGGWIVSSTQASGDISVLCASGCAPVTLLHAGLYTLDDWERMQAYGLIWFDGDGIERGAASSHTATMI